MIFEYIWWIYKWRFSLPEKTTYCNKNIRIWMSLGSPSNIIIQLGSIGDNWVLKGSRQTDKTHLMRTVTSAAVAAVIAAVTGPNPMSQQMKGQHGSASAWNFVAGSKESSDWKSQNRRTRSHNATETCSNLLCFITHFPKNDRHRFHSTAVGHICCINDFRLLGKWKVSKWVKAK